MADSEKPVTCLDGKCFMTRDARGRSLRQGQVRAVLSSQQGDVVLVQYFEALMGTPNTLALIPLANMIERDGFEGYVFFNDDEHLRDYFDDRQHDRDKAIDRGDRV